MARYMEDVHYGDTTLMNKIRKTAFLEIFKRL